MKRINALCVARARTAEERLRRHLYGDVGATYSKGKYGVLVGPVMSTVTTAATKDNLCAEVYETH